MGALNDALGSAVDKLNSLIGLGGSNWRDSLQPASFRGIPFEVFDSTLSGGHRNVIHEYPNRDVGWVESMGAATETFNLSAFVAGDDYFVKRDELIAALRDSSEPGILVDPYMGEVTVVCDTWDKAEVTADGRMAVFTMSFTVAGDPATLLTESDSDTGQSFLSEAMELLSDASKELSDTIALVGEPARIVNAAINKVKSEVALAYKRIESAVEGVIQAYSDLLNQFTPDAGSNAFSDDNLAAIQNIVAMIPSIDDVMSLSDAYDTEPHDPVISATAAVSEQTRQNNDFAIKKFFNSTYLGNAAALAVKTEIASYDDAVVLRDRLVGKLIRAGKQETAATAFRYLSNRAFKLSRLVDIETPHFVSTIETAQLLYGDAERAAEINSRNNIEHPGFIVGQTLKVLEK